MSNQTTLEQAIEMRDLWLAALKGLATAQSYSINTGGAQRTLSRANLKEAQESYKFWEAQVYQLSPGRKRVRFGVPL